MLDYTRLDDLVGMYLDTLEEIALDTDKTKAIAYVQEEVKRRYNECYPSK